MDFKKIQNESTETEFDDDDYIPVFDCEPNGEILLDSLLDAIVEDAPPDLPPFVDNLRVVDITKEIERLLAVHLDLRCHAGQQTLNWQTLADILGMSWQEILYLEERARSPTCELLLLYQNENLGHVLRIIRDQLKRYDVIANLIPSLLALEERLKLSKSSCAACSQVASASFNGYDSGHPTTEFPSCSHHSHTGTVNLRSIQSTSALPASDIIDLRLSQSKEQQSLRLSHSFANQPANSSLQFPPAEAAAFPKVVKSNEPIILVSYADEADAQHVKYVRWLCKNLKQYTSATIVTDEVQDTLEQSSDPIGWLDTMFHIAKSIVVVISPTYSRHVQSSDDVTNVLDQHQKNIVYLFKLMAAEYRNYGARNKRFRPVVFKSEDSSHVPLFLRSTIVYTWPNQQDKLISLIKTDVAR